jgi:hypothetical protein
VALCATCLYSLLTALGSLRPPTARTLFILLLLDVVSALLITTTSTAYDLLLPPLLIKFSYIYYMT